MCDVQIGSVGGDVCVVSVRGKLQGSHARDLEERLEGLRREGVRGLLIDLSDCLSMDSLGQFALQTAIRLGFTISVSLGLNSSLTTDLSRAGLPRASVHRFRAQAIEALRPALAPAA